MPVSSSSCPRASLHPLLLNRILIAYSTTLLEQVPIKHILAHAELSPDYREIYPDLLCCVANQYPELFDVRASLIDVGSREQEEIEWRISSKRSKQPIVTRKRKGNLWEQLNAVKGKTDDEALIVLKPRIRKHG